MLRRIRSLFIFPLLMTAIVSSNLAGQETDPKPLELPECDIFSFDMQEMRMDRSGPIKISNPRNVTSRAGYDNQPWFTPDSKSFIYTANGKPDRTDVFEYFIESGETKQVTDTPNQEYSPQASSDNETISFVTDGATANQSIWFAKRSGGEEEWLLANQGEREPVGYYSWNRNTGNILYWSRYGHSIRLVHESKKLSHYVTGNAPPSTPHIIPGTSKFSFLHRQGNGETWIKELDPETLAVRPLTAIKGSNNNYCWTPLNQILMADGNKLYRRNLEDDEAWTLVADLEEHGITDVTRVACSPDGVKLAVVGLPIEKE